MFYLGKIIMFLYHWTLENETIQFFLLLLGVLSFHDLRHSSGGIQELLQRKGGLLRPWVVQGLGRKERSSLSVTETEEGLFYQEEVLGPL